MKKLFLVITGVCCANFVSAQVSGGIKGGVNLASQKWEIKFQGESASESYKGTGFHIGGYLHYSLSEVVSMQPELLYNSLKIDLEGDDLSFNYISVPVMFGYGSDNNRLIIQAGPQVGVLLSTAPDELKDEEAYKTIDFSFNLGVVVNFNLSVRYSIGLANLTGDALQKELESVFGSDIDLAIKNNNLQFSVGYRLFGEN